jgi:hypothetical protein
MASVYKKGDKKNCNNCQGILLPSTFRISSSIVLSMLNLYTHEIVGGH